MPITKERNTELLTNGRMMPAKSCLRRHYYEYELGIRRVQTSRPLRIGATIHAALDMWARGYGVDDIIEHIRSLTYIGPDGSDQKWQMETWIEAETCVALILGYIAYWQQKDTIRKYISSEDKFDLPLINPLSSRQSRQWRIAGKIDKIAELADGRTAIIEHKTTSDSIQPDSDYWKRLRLDQQISLYFMAAQAIYGHVDTIIYDVIRKPFLSPSQIPILDENDCKVVTDQAGNRVFNKNGAPRQAASHAEGWSLSTRTETPDEYGKRLQSDINSRPEFYFARQEIPRLDADLDEFKLELWQQQKLISFCRANGHWFRNTNACVSPYKCPYFDICTNGIDLEEFIPEGFTRVGNIHPELEDSNATPIATPNVAEIC